MSRKTVSEPFLRARFQPGSRKMNLLPKSHEEFSKVDYWNDFFKKRGTRAFEWYGEYPELCGQLLKYIKPKDDVLIVGCGNSTLSMDLYDVGYRSVASIDISRVVVKQMLEKNKEQRPDLIFECMDATATTYPDEKFSVVLDKGTLDALMPDQAEETIVKIDKFFSEIARLLRRGGRYVCITLLQEHILRKLVSHFPSNGFMLRVARCYEAEAKTRETEGTSFPVFVVIATKFPGLPQPVLELSLIENKIVRVDNGEIIMNGVMAVQQSSLVCNTLYKRSIGDVGEITLDLFSPGNKDPRYTIHVLDKQANRAGRSYAAFIVPQGRDTDWIFGTPEGRQQILKNVSKDRVAVVVLRREHTFESMEKVKEELGPSIKNFSPSGVPENYVIDFLSLGSDVGKREVRCKGESKISGPYVVEDVLGDEGHTYRRLIFLNNQFAVQSEAKLKSVKNRRGKMKTICDLSVLACEHHPYMCVGVNAAINPEEPSDVLVVGLGGGGLCAFLHNFFPKLNITAVDIDAEVLKIATTWFDLVLDERMKVEIMDGVRFIREASENGRKFDAILFDVDSKDMSLGMSCPPKSFLEAEVLRGVWNCLNEDGCFVLNLVCRDKNLRPGVVKVLKEIFASMISLSLEDHLNEIFVCSKKNRESEDLKGIIVNAAKNLNSHATTKKPSNRVIEVSSLLESLNIEP